MIPAMLDAHFSLLNYAFYSKNYHPIIIENEELPIGKIIIDTGDLEQSKIDEYNDQIKHYTTGIVVLKDKIRYI